MLPELQLPTYEVTLPTTKKKVKYRPFVVKEEKILLLAIEEGKSDSIVRSMKQIVSACTFEKLDVDSMTAADIEFLFVHIRNKSFGEGVEIQTECSKCKTKKILTLDMSKINITKKTMEPEIELEKGKVWVIMKYPTMNATYKLLDATDEVSAAEEYIASCIDKLIIGESTYDYTEVPLEKQIDFIGNLTHKHIELLQEFISSAPKVYLEDKFVCVNCGETNSILLEGLDSFFA